HSGEIMRQSGYHCKPRHLSYLLAAGAILWLLAQSIEVDAAQIYFAATPQRIVEAMLTLAHVTRDDVVYDLGSGDGRIVIIAAQEYGARGVGIEIDPGLVQMSRLGAHDGAVDNRVTFREEDLFMADISQATVVTLWLSPGLNARLEPKLRRELRPGT